MPFVIAAIVALFSFFIYAMIAENNAWQAFKIAHECKQIGHMKGDIFNTVGVGANGQVSVGIGSTPDKTGWSCNNGMTYWR